jgi:glycosyltransferase involved in cell wall biosynthesis
VVAADVGDLKNIIRQGETGYVVEDNSPEKLAAGIKTLLSNPQLDAESTLSIRASVSRYDWSEIARKIAAEMKTVLASRLAPVL